MAKFPFEEVPPTAKQTKLDPESASPVLESADPGSAPGSALGSDSGSASAWVMVSQDHSAYRATPTLTDHNPEPGTLRNVLEIRSSPESSSPQQN